MRIMEYVDGCVTCLAPVNNVYKFSGRDWQAHLLPYAKDFLDLVFLFLFGVPVTQMIYQFYMFCNSYSHSKQVILNIL